MCADTSLALLREAQFNFRPDSKLKVTSMTIIGDVEDNDTLQTVNKENTGTEIMCVLGCA